MSYLTFHGWRQSIVSSRPPVWSPFVTRYVPSYSRTGNLQGHKCPDMQDSCKQFCHCCSAGCGPLHSFARPFSSWSSSSHNHSWQLSLPPTFAASTSSAAITSSAPFQTPCKRCKWPPGTRLLNAIIVMPVHAASESNDDPDGIDDPGQVAKDGEQDIDPEILVARSLLKEDSQGREDDRSHNLEDVRHCDCHRVLRSLYCGKAM